MSVLDSILRVIETKLARLDTYALYEGTVVKQTSDGLLEVKLDDDRFGSGFQHLEIAFGIPGVEVEVDSGARVAVGFLDGRRDKPIVRHWLSGEAVSISISADTIKLGGSAILGVARLGDTAGPYAITTASSKVLAE